MEISASKIRLDGGNDEKELLLDIIRPASGSHLILRCRFDCRGVKFQVSIWNFKKIGLIEFRLSKLFPYRVLYITSVWG